MRSIANLEKSHATRLLNWPPWIKLNKGAGGIVKSPPGKSETQLSDLCANWRNYFCFPAEIRGPGPERRLRSEKIHLRARIKPRWNIQIARTIRFRFDRMRGGDGRLVWQKTTLYVAAAAISWRHHLRLVSFVFSRHHRSAKTRIRLYRIYHASCATSICHVTLA